MKRPTALPAALLLLAASLPQVALAHGGHGAHEHALWSGLIHPFTGLDHLAAMLAVGVWSALIAQRAASILIAPASFAALLLVGALIGLAGITLPAVEPMIAVSSLVIGLLVATRTRLPAAAVGMIVGAFAVFHGAAHGTELAGEGAAMAITGMLIGTALLHGFGIGIGLLLRERHSLWMRVSGGVVSLFGFGLLTAMA